MYSEFPDKCLKKFTTLRHKIEKKLILDYLLSEKWYYSYKYIYLCTHIFKNLLKMKMLKGTMFELEKKVKCGAGFAIYSPIVCHVTSLYIYILLCKMEILMPDLSIFYFWKVRGKGHWKQCM